MKPGTLNSKDEDTSPIAGLDTKEVKGLLPPPASNARNVDFSSDLGILFVKHMHICMHIYITSLFLLLVGFHFNEHI